MNKEKLLLLADLLEQNANNPVGMKFDLRIILSTEKSGQIPMRSCGTTGCAIGLACISPEFPDLSPASFSEYNVTLHELDFYGAPTSSVVSWIAAAKLVFDISTEAANHLFVDYFYPVGLPTSGRKGELMVAQRIRDFVSGEYVV